MSTTVSSTSAGDQRPKKPAEVAPPQIPLLEKVRQLLAAGRADEAKRLLVREHSEHVLVKNALGVCLLRLGQFDDAVKLFRGIALTGHGIVVRTDVPTIVKSNFATALLLRGEVDGCLSILSESQDLQHPSVIRLYEAVQRWKKTLTIGQRLHWWLGVPPEKPVPLDFEPGEI